MFKSLKEKLKNEVAAVMASGVESPTVAAAPTTPSVVSTAATTPVVKGTSTASAGPPSEESLLTHPELSAGTPPSHLDVSAEDIAMFEAAPRTELVDVLRKRTVQCSRYRIKMADLVTAYKDVARSKEKLEAMLEAQQDSAERRTKDLGRMHAADLEAKDRLLEAIKRQLVERDDNIRQLKQVGEEADRKSVV